MGKVSSLGFCLLVYFALINTTGAVSLENINKLNISETTLWDTVLSPDGSKIAYLAYDTARNQQIFVMNIDGSGAMNVTNTTLKKWGLSWGPEKIAYLSTGKDGLEKIFVVNPDGTGNKQLILDNTRQGNKDKEDKPPAMAAPSWSRDGKFLVYTSLDNKSNQKIYMVNSDGTGKIPLINDTFRQWSPSINPDGKSIVYVSYTDNNIEELFSSDIDGAARKQITSDGINKNYPVWMTGGIIYVSYEAKTSYGEKIFYVNTDGTQRILFAPATDYKQRSPSVSNDGKKFAFIAIDNTGNSKIATADLPEMTAPVAIVPAVTAIPTSAPASTQTSAIKREDTIETPVEVSSQKVMEEPKVTSLQQIPDEHKTSTENKEVPAGNSLEQIITLMLIVLGIIVLVMLLSLAASDSFFKKN